MENHTFDMSLFSMNDTEASQKFSKMRIFIQGLKGLGTEIAKNILLSNPAQLMISDRSIITENDIDLIFLLIDNDVGKKKEDVIYEKLNEISHSVSKFDGKLPENLDKLKGFNLVIITEIMSFYNINLINTFCRENKIGFIYTCSLGLFGYIFVDYGDFVIFDKDGEESKKYFIKSISKASSGVVEVIDPDNEFDLKTGDYVILKDVLGMNEVNDSPPRPIIVLKKGVFTVEDTTKFSEYSSGGIVEKIKIPKPVEFRDFKESLERPFQKNVKYFNNSISEIDRNQLHLFLFSLFEFYDRKGKLPELHDEIAFELYLSIAKDIVLKYKDTDWVSKFYNNDFDREFAKKFCFWSSLEIPPTATFLAGIVSLEVTKITGRFTPLNQWLHSDFSDLIEKEQINLVDQNLPKDKPNYNLINIFGHELVEKIYHLNFFIIGAGQLASEICKILALVGASKKGKIILTDFETVGDDKFIMKNKNQEKTLTRTNYTHNEIKKINSEMKIQALNLNLGNDEFLREEWWNGIDFVINAVNHGRIENKLKIISSFFKKKLFDQKIDGVKGFVKCIIPNVTDGEISHFKSEKKVLVDTQDIIDDAQNYYHSLFYTNIKFLKKYLESKTHFFERLVSFDHFTRVNIMKKIKFLLQILKNNLAASVELAIMVFYEEFEEKIKKMTHSTENNKKDFNRFDDYELIKKPIPISFDPKNQKHQNFIQYYLTILYDILGLPKFSLDLPQIIEISKTVKTQYQKGFINLYVDEIVDYFNPQQRIKVIDALNNDIQLKIELFNFEINNFKSESLAMRFYKDSNESDRAFLMSICNFKAINFNIKEFNELPKFNPKTRVGDLNPSLTCFVAGLISIQILYELNNRKNLQNCEFNLSLPNISYTELPMSNRLRDGPDYIYLPKNCTYWDVIEINSAMTVEKLIEKLKNDHEVDVFLFVSQSYILYDKEYHGDSKKNYRIEDLYFAFKRDRTPNIIIPIECYGHQNNCKVILPIIKYKLN